MTDEEREEKYVEKADCLISSRKELLDVIDRAITISNGMVLGSALLSLTALIVNPNIITELTVNPNIDSLIPVAVGGISLGYDILCRLWRRSIIKNTYKTAIELVDQEYEHDEPDKNSADSLSLVEKSNLLINYAEEVAYPDYEQDISFIEDVINGYKNGMISIEEAHENITSMESSMLDKAYHFYTEDFER